MFKRHDYIQVVTPGSQEGKVGKIIDIYAEEDRPYIVGFPSERGLWSFDEGDLEPIGYHRGQFLTGNA